MNENDQGKTASEPIVTEDNSAPSSSSTQDQRGTEQLQNNRMEATIKPSKDRGYKVTAEDRRDTPRQPLKVSVKRDWLQLLIIPFLIFLLGIGFTLLQNLTSRQIATDQQQEATLQTYLGDMSALLLTQHLSTSKPGDVVREVARERTLTTLRRLDAHRNTILLRFLQDAHLFGIQNAVINLSNADLSNDDLSGADLSGIDLSGTILNGATLNDADLNGAILDDANLSGAILNDADLGGAHLDGAILNDADLSGADLSGADLSYAILNGADLSYAHLNGTNLTPHQLSEVYSCTNAISSAGLKCLNRSVVTLTYWYTETQAETPVILQRIQQFRQQNPNIRINAVYKPFLQAQAAFITAARAGNAPDVLRSDIGWITQFASQSDLLNIDSYSSQSHLDLSDYLSVPLSYDKYNGHLYGLPQVTDFLALLYNKAELAKVGITSPPATMADFEAAAMKVVQSKAAKYGFETTGTSYYVLPFLWAFGGGMIDPSNNILVNDMGSVAGLNFLLKLQNTDKVMPPKVDFSNGYNNMVNDLKSGETAMIFDGPWEVSNILTGEAFTGNSSNLGIAGIPTGPGGQTGSPVGGQSYVISAHTAHPAEAYKFISFMSSMASQVAIAKANHTLPTRNSAYPSVSGDPVISAFYNKRSTAVARPAIPQGGYLFDAFDSNIQAALDGAENPTDALTAVAEVWKELLASS